MEPPVDVSPEFIQPRPPRTGRVLIDVLVGGVAILLSVISLIVAIQNERTQRELVAASSWPFVQVEFDATSSEDDTISLIDTGVGPAKIESFEMFYRGHLVDSPFALLQQCCGLSTDVAVERTQLSNGILIGSSHDIVLRPADSRLVMRLLKGINPASLVRQRFSEAFSDITYRACYCSVLDECWLSNLIDLHPHRVATCPAAEHQLAIGPTSAFRKP